ncbi:unnamed protein product [Acanthoscelides obtectus]|uniref:O-acyltransferase n=1 Tax=Acanthoscelides obtectus TaxID=200917 RepID=A0A9P0KWC8_ACAOB|nr:unnamed protein product [Acanthoscelides obtectus]CAK1662975.1 Diacylglycerol O-acyltransferase 1 [Acanthoscelides obtectus]
MTEQEGIRKRERAQSVTRAEEIQAEEQKARKNQHDKPCHKPRDSLFSWNSGFDNFTGFVNWAFLLLSIGGLRLLLENFIKYGIRIDPIQWIKLLVDDQPNSEHPSIAMILYSVVPVVLCLLIEKGLAVEIISTVPGMFVHIINLLVVILLPMIVIHFKEGFNLIGASCVCTIYSILFLKLWSYIQVNMWCRTARQNAKSGMRRQSLSHSDLKSDDSKDLKVSLVLYPDNLNLKDLYYFIFAPTLCYELNFPKTVRIRKRFLLKRIFEVLVCGQIIMVIMQQYMVPSIKNSLIPFSNMDYTRTAERLLKLAIPNHLAWLIGFYLMFHSWLNLVGEVLHFADRSFYNDWWNANNIDMFWRNWNLPVHRWALRHLYFPMIEMGYGRQTGSIAVFFISAFFHEYMVSVPLKTYKIWAFMGMMGQIPLSYISKFIEKQYGPRFGNIIFWASIILGQPLVIMMYFHDYIVVHYGEALLEDYSHI